jgi:DNA-binding response OmpR family regulator
MTKVLIIDDDPGIRDILKIILERAGYEAMLESGGECVLHDDYQLPDIILLDRYLSGTDGLDICRHLKSSAYSANTPVVMISATPDLAPLAIAAGADDFIEKPFNICDLLKIVEKHTALHV